MYAQVTPDPVGDTLGSGPVQIDLTSMLASFNSSGLTVTLTFAGNVAAPSAGLANSVTGYVDFDTDRNAATGVTSFTQNYSGKPLTLGDEYYADLFSEQFHAGTIDLFDQNDVRSGSAAITYGAKSLSFTAPLSAFGGKGGPFNWGVIVGTFSEVTDRGPNGITPLVTTVPEPGMLALVVGFGAAGGGFLRRRAIRNT